MIYQTTPHANEKIFMVAADHKVTELLEGSSFRWNTLYRSIFINIKLKIRESLCVGKDYFSRTEGFWTHPFLRVHLIEPKTSQQVLKRINYCDVISLLLIEIFPFVTCNPIQKEKRLKF